MKKHGFTLIELLVVIAILAIFVAIVLQAVSFKARPEKDRTDMREHVQTDMTATNAAR